MFEILSSLVCFMSSTLMFIAPIGLFAFLLKHSMNQAENGKKELARTAQQLGLSIGTIGTHRGPSLQGAVHGTPVNIFETRRRRTSGRSHASRYIYTTVYRIPLNPQHVPPGLHVYREGFVSKLGKLTGGQDIQLDDETFDKTFIIRATSPDDAHTFFQGSHIKESLLLLNRFASNFFLKDNVLHFESTRQMIYEVDDLPLRLERLLNCSRAVSGLPPIALTPQPQRSLPQPISFAPPQPVAPNIPATPEPQNPLEDSNISW